MKLLFAFILLIFCVKISSAQSTYIDYEGDQNISHVLKLKIRPVPSMVENCQMPFTYVKFKVTESNTVDSLIVTNDNYPDVKQEIIRVMQLTNGHWNIEQTKGKWFIIPVIFYTDYKKNKMGKGCDFKKILTDQNNEMEYKNNEANAVYLPLVKINTQFSD